MDEKSSIVIPILTLICGLYLAYYFVELIFCQYNENNENVKKTVIIRSNLNLRHFDLTYFLYSRMLVFT